MKKAYIKINFNYEIGSVDRKIFSTFIEHMGRSIYGGIYDKNNPNSDKDGFREDVLKLVKELNMPLIRYPGGNFLSGYDWKDGIGNQNERPKRLDLAWGQVETNEIGINEFASWCKKAGLDMIMAVNLGTGTQKDAKELVEYCNHKGGTYLSDLREQKEPYAIKYWCLGNEMDGNWQICAQTADEYGRKAVESAKLMKWVDSDIKLTICGSSSPELSTFPMWDRKVLEYTYEFVDYISLHRYYTYPNGDRNRKKDFLASFMDFNKYIQTISAVTTYVKALKRSEKEVYLSVDEWNIWHPDKTDCTLNDRWEIAPPRLENNYDLLDALSYSGLMLTLLNNVDKVKCACTAQLINVIGLILTNKEQAIKQTIFYPFQMASNNANGIVLNTKNISEKVDTIYGKAPLILSSTVYNEENGEINVFILNSDLNDEVQINIEFCDNIKAKLVGHSFISGNGEDKNTFENPNEIIIKNRNIEEFISDKFELMVDKLSFNLFKFKIN